MCRTSALGGNLAVPIQTQPTLDRWYTVQTRRSQAIWQGHHNHQSQTHHNKNKQPPVTQHSNQLTIDDYKGYEGLAAFGNVSGPINTEETWRLVGRNVNGIKPSGVNEKLGGTAIELWHMQAASASLIEQNVEWHRYEYRKKEEWTFKLEFGAAKAELGTSSEIFENTHYKPGGTAMIALGPWEHNIVELGGDPIGCRRWNYITCDGEEGKRTTVISAYRVGNQHQPGALTSSQQQYRIQYQDEPHTIYIGSHQQTMIDLESFAKPLQAKCQDVLLFIDANEGIKNGFQPQGHKVTFKTDHGFHVDDKIDGYVRTFMENCGLVNIIAEKHGPDVPRTHI
jgi:hypothetical protein